MHALIIQFAAFSLPSLNAADIKQRVDVEFKCSICSV